VKVRGPTVFWVKVREEGEKTPDPRGLSPRVTVTSWVAVFQSSLWVTAHSWRV
jgi:hypothetical protein